MIVREHRVVISRSLRERVSADLHTGHFGIVKMKASARGNCWWPSISADVEKIVISCETCQLYQNNPKPVETHV